MPDKNNLRKTTCGKTLVLEIERDIPNVPRIEIESQQKQVPKANVQQKPEKFQSSNQKSLSTSTYKQKSPIPSPKTIRYNLQPKVEVKMSNNQSLPEFLAKSPIPSPNSTLRRTGFKITSEEDSQNHVNPKSPQNRSNNREVGNKSENPDEATKSDSSPQRISEVIRSLENFDLDNLLEKTNDKAPLEHNGKIDFKHSVLNSNNFGDVCKIFWIHKRLRDFSKGSIPLSYQYYRKSLSCVDAHLS